MEHWLAKVLSLKHKRGGGLASSAWSHYGARVKGPPTSVSEDGVRERVGGYVTRVVVFSHGGSEVLACCAPPSPPPPPPVVPC